MDSEERARREAERAASDERLGKLAELIGGSVTAKAVFGEPVERDGVTVIPVARIRYGFGAGSGQGGNRRRRPEQGTDGEDQYGSGGGGGAQAGPVGYIELRDGEARFTRIGPAKMIVAALMAPFAALALALVVLAVGRGWLTRCG